MSRTIRIKDRRLSLLSKSYLAHNSLWPKILRAIDDANTLIKGLNSRVVIDVGCGEKPYADCFDGLSYVGLNYSTEGACPDVVGDAQCLPFADSCAGIVFSTQVIEHIPRPDLLVKEAFRVLAPGGVIVLSGPFYWPLHEEPHDYFRFTKYGLKHLLSSAGFEIIRIENDARSFTQAAVSLIESLPRQLKYLIPVINFITPLLQRLFRDGRSTLNYICIARRP